MAQARKELLDEESHRNIAEKKATYTLNQIKCEKDCKQNLLDEASKNLI
jgi:hypothetical protein